MTSVTQFAPSIDKITAGDLYSHQDGGVTFLPSKRHPLLAKSSVKIKYVSKNRGLVVKVMAPPQLGKA